MSIVRARHAPARIPCSLTVAPARRRAIRLWQVRQGRRVLPQCRAGLRPRPGHARGNLSLAEKDRLVRSVEERILPMKEIATVYARSGERGRGQRQITEDVIGQIQFEFVDWQERRPAGVIMDEIRAKTADIPGHQGRGDRAAGRPADRQADPGPAHRLRSRGAPPRREGRGQLAERPEIRDLDNGLPMPGIDWRPRSTRRRRPNTASASRRRRRGPARHQRPQDHRLPAERPTSRST